MRRPALAWTLVAAIGVLLAAAAGCSAPKKVMAPNLPPETTVYLSGSVDPVSHRVHIYWFGSDPDGDVVAYQMRFVPSGGSSDPNWGTVFCAMPGRCTDSVFTVFTGDSALIHTQFEIRSVDDQGALDPTPAVQRFALTNLAPQPHISNPLRRADSTFASVTISWTVDDPDGGGPGLRYRIWLDGGEASYDSTALNTFTVPSPRFLEGGAYRTRYRKLFLQAVDDGGRSGPVDSMEWYVRAPGRRDINDPLHHRSLLVIDDSRSTAQNNFTVDTFYVQTLRRNSYPDSCFVIQRLEYSNPFRSTADLEQTLALFDAVVWYRGYDFHAPSDFKASLTLKNYQDVLGAYIEGGGRVLLEGLFLIGGRQSFGALRPDFVQRYLNCRDMIVQYSANLPDSTVGITMPQSGLRLRSPLFADPGANVQLTALPGIQGVGPGLRGFVPNDTTQVAYWALAGQITDLDSVYYRTPENVPLAVTVSRPPGRLILLPYPSRALVAPPSLPFNRRPLARLLGLNPALSDGLLSP